MNMPSLRTLFCTYLFAIAVTASPVRSTYAVKDRHYVPSRWSKVQRAPADHLINLQIGLKQSQFDELERHLYEGRWLAGQPLHAPTNTAGDIVLISLASMNSFGPFSPTIRAASHH